MEHAGVEWEGDHVIPYHLYRIPSGMEMGNAVVFASTKCSDIMDPADEKSWAGFVQSVDVK